ncbi:MAG: hypothetical protein M4D80_33520 [Myxococcota bacterium]|nr:hypothetical protein [Deltaproteobacteria bacterium]MDQ3340105.1 hypothetical protein [Myxococcota bacterium]
MRCALVLALLAGCYEPKLAPCAVRCAAGVGCPDDTVCGPDANCHDPGDTKLCPPSLLTLTARTGGNGAGKINGGPIDCGSTCTASVLEGTVVTLVAVEEAGSRFGAWSGPCMPNVASCELIIRDDVELQADFVALARLDVTFEPAGTGTGRVVSEPAGIDCATDCNGDFDLGTQVQLFAVPDDGSQLTMWGGACADAGECIVTLDASPRSVVVQFDTVN